MFQKRRITPRKKQVKNRKIATKLNMMICVKLIGHILARVIGINKRGYRLIPSLLCVKQRQPPAKQVGKEKLKRGKK